MDGSGAEFVADVLVRRGVRFLFTLCGGHVSPILAPRRLADDVDGVLAEARVIARSGRPAYVNAQIGRTDFRKGSISI